MLGLLNRCVVPLDNNHAADARCPDTPGAMRQQGIGHMTHRAGLGNALAQT